MVYKNKIENNCSALGLFLVLNANNQMVKKHLLTILCFQELPIILWVIISIIVKRMSFLVEFYEFTTLDLENDSTPLRNCFYLNMGESKTSWLLFPRYA